jgi:hypothetical protein
MNRKFEDSQMKQSGVREGILKILLSIVGVGVLLVCILGVLFSVHEWGKLEWFLVGAGIASLFWFIHHLKKLTLLGTMQ